jgi:peptidoglycan/LPS O-acetylase OafA/YrhL
VTSGGQYFPEVDGVRFVAIVMVLLQHAHERVLRRTQDIYPLVSDQAMAFGGGGVALFFALSGFILYRGLSGSLGAGRGLRAKEYFLRRVTRLEPPYLIVMTAIALYLVLIGYESPYIRQIHSGPDSILAAWAASATYTYCLVFGEYPKLNVPAWSLEVEVQFYLLAPLIAWLLFKTRTELRPYMILVVGIAWSVFASPWAIDLAHLRFSIASQMPYFLVGVLVHEIGTRNAGSAQKWGRTADLVGLIFLGALLTVLTGRLFAVPVALKAAAVGLTLWGMLNGVLWRRVLSVPWISVAGGMCYSIYLVHLPLMEVGANVTARIAAGLPYPLYFLIQCVLLFALVGVVAGGFYVLIERPCMNKSWPRDLLAYLRRIARAAMPLATLK